MCFSNNTRRAVTILLMVSFLETPVKGRFKRCLPGPIEDYKFTSDDAAATSKGELADRMYALTRHYLVWMKTRRDEDPWPPAFRAALASLYPALTTKRLKSKWEKLRKRFQGLEIQPIDDTHYLTNDKVPITTRSMLKPMVKAIHEEYGHRSARQLRVLFEKHMVAPGLNKVLITETQNVDCAHCSNNRPLPKDVHKGRVGVSRKGERWQMDHAQIASNKLNALKDLRGSGYRHILTVMALFIKKGWVFPKTLDSAEVVKLLRELLRYEVKFKPI